MQSHLSPRHIPEVPLDVSDAGQLRRFLVDMRELLHAVVATGPPSSPPSNLQVTGIAGGVAVKWTRGQGADGHELLWNTQPTLNGAHIVDMANGAEWTHYTGLLPAPTKFYYWVRSYGTDNKRSTETGPAAATPQPFVTSVALPHVPVPAQEMALDSTRGYAVPKHPRLY